MDETQPLLSSNGSENYITQQQQQDQQLSSNEVSKTIIVEFDPNGDPANPITWPPAYKRGVVTLLAFMAFTVTFTCISVVPVATRIVQDLDKNHKANKSSSVLLVTIWEFGEAAGPLFIGPLSELFGRYRVLSVANALFIVCTITAACCQSTHLFIAARWLTGVVVATNVLNPAIVGDIYLPDQRGSAMSLMILAPIIGGTIGPVISGAITESLGWRQVLWMAAALATICEVLLVCLLRETYEVTILKKRAADLRALPENTGKDIKTIFEVKEAEQGSNARNRWISITRPFYVFFDSMVLQLLSLLSGVTFTYFYILSTTLPDIVQNYYNLSPAMTGLSFISHSAGSIVVIIICNKAIDGIYIKLRESNKGVGQPEFRLPLVILGTITLPLSVMCYGWVVDLHLPLWVLLVCVGLQGATLMLTYLPLSAYVIDALGIYSASGMTVIIVTRCLMCTFLPLTTPPLIAKFGHGWAFTLLGGVTLLFAPIPILLYRYGSRWRTRSMYTKEE